MFDLRGALLDFGAFHQTRGNRVCHAIGLPCIAAAVLGGLAHLRVPFLDVDAAVVLLALTLLLDLALNVRIALGVLLLGTALYLAARGLPWQALAGLFASGWIFQLLGHRAFEKNAPAFLQNARHLFVGPRWLVNRIVRALPDTASASRDDPAQ